MGMLTYPITRFSLEYLRGDEMGQFGTSFTISQWVSVGLFCGGLVYLFWLSRRPQTVTLAHHPPTTQKPRRQTPRERRRRLMGSCGQLLQRG